MGTRCNLMITNLDNDFVHVANVLRAEWSLSEDGHEVHSDDNKLR